MSLLRLLTAGKSLVGLRDQPSRYIARGGLPKFGSKKNPFRVTTKPEFGISHSLTRKSAAESLEVKAGALEPSAELGSQGVELRKAGDLDQANSTAVLSPSAIVAERPGTPVVGGWNYKTAMGYAELILEKMTFWRKSKPARPVVPRFAKPMFQGELSLDGIKVVRNDLTDSDLEVVRAKPPVPVPATTPTPKQLEKTVSPGNAWSRVTGRLFGAGKV